MSSHTEPHEVFKLFKDDPDYASQTSIPERRLQFLFLVVTHILHVPSIVRSLAGNCTASHRDPRTMIQECKDALPPDLLAQIKRALIHYNPTNFVGHVEAEQRRQSRSYGNHSSVKKTIFQR